MNQNQSSHGLANYGETPIDYSYDCMPQSVGAGDSSFSKKPDSEGDDDDDDGDKDSKRAGRRKIKIEYIQDKSRRHITFSKRKAGIMKKAYELSTLTGTQVLLLVVSETGLVYTFTTPKLQPLVTKTEGKNLIQSCLNTPDEVTKEDSVAPEAGQGDNSSSNGRDSSIQNNSRESQTKKIPEQNGTSVQTKRQTTEPSPGLPPSYAGSVSSAYAPNPAASFPQGLPGNYPSISGAIPPPNQPYQSHPQNPFMGQPSHQPPMQHPSQHSHPGQSLSQPLSHHQNQVPPHQLHHVPSHQPLHGHQSTTPQQQQPHHVSAMPPQGYHDYHNGAPHYGQPQAPPPAPYPNHNPGNYYNHPGAPPHQ